MKRRIFLGLVCIFLLASCTKKEKDIQIRTIIEEKEHYKVSINYPETSIKALDNVISKYVNSCYDNFLKRQIDEKALETLEEINIDYTFYQNEEVISITIFKVDNNEKEMKTFNYNFKKKSFFTVKDIIKEDILYDKASTYLFKRFGNIIDTSLVSKNLKTRLFSLDEENLYLYYMPNSISLKYPEIIIIDIPLKELNISSEETKKTIFEVKNSINSKKVDSIIDGDSKIVALTFDDGPSSYTEDIINILKENDVVATFFILGNKVKTYEEVLKKSISYGNEIGNHTYNHKWLTKLTDEEIKSQIERTQEVIKETLGYTPRLFRPSYGSINKRVRKDVNLDVVLWNIDTMDWKYKSVDKIVNRAVRNVADGSIILMHDTHKRTKDALPKIISILKEKGFIFVTISELKEINNLRKLNGR